MRSHNEKINRHVYCDNPFLVGSNMPLDGGFHCRFVVELVYIKARGDSR